ncbi:hypothetical protein [Streptomyces sp. B3I8]|uniref:hypothetical protein n=1 Tax=Streptomyces sp. B3I8 TaxID=3042303 RepID=UPI002788BB8B|nr:hypothetical protein [Streptomyces sp. B3I8]MDQ0785113.1 hypothetical protein [Streptomyces sp. B3I8]
MATSVKDDEAVADEPSVGVGEALDRRPVAPPPALDAARDAGTPRRTPCGTPP